MSNYFYNCAAGRSLTTVTVAVTAQSAGEELQHYAVFPIYCKVYLVLSAQTDV